MGSTTGIEWASATWNPVVGCSKVSPGCAHCYAELVHRQRFSDRYGYPKWSPWTPGNAARNVTLMPHRLLDPFRWRAPRMVFVNSMSDLFHELVPDEYIARVFAVMGSANRHTYQVLTKRPERMRELLGSERFPRLVDQVADAMEMELSWLATRAMPWPNVWLGTSIENRRFVDRADHLRATPAALRFVSAEPLLGPLLHDSEAAWRPGSPPAPAWSTGTPRFAPQLDLTDIDWLIVGGESGVGHRPMNLQWVRALRDACLATGERCGFCAGRGWVADPDAPVTPECWRCHGRGRFGGTSFFLKQIGGVTPKAGGHLLDDQVWREMPVQDDQVRELAA